MEDKVLNKKGFILVDFYADWCGPCKMLKPILNEVSKDFKNIEFSELNIDEDKNRFAKKMGVMSIPTLILFKDGEEIKRNIGFINKEELIKFLIIK